MTPRTNRTILRTLHLLLAVPMGAVVYMPPSLGEPIRLFLAFVGLPLLTLSGLSMWLQGRWRRWLGRGKGRHAP